MTIWNFRVAAFLVIMIMALAAGCASAGGPAAGEPAPELRDVTVAALPAADLGGLYVAQDEGLFAQQGLQVKIIKIASSAAVITDQLAGRVDIGAGAYVPYIRGQAAGARFRILAEASFLQPHTRVLATTAGSPITAIADLKGKKIGVNGTNSIGTLLISALLFEYGISPGQVHFMTDPGGFPTIPGHLQDGAWDVAFLSEPYVTFAEEHFGEQELADMDQGYLSDFPIDGYVTTRAWVKKYPKTAAAFVRAIGQGQAIARRDRHAVEVAMEKSDKLPPVVAAAMALPGYPTGPVAEADIQRVAQAMLEFGMLSGNDSAAIENETVVGSMIDPGA